MTQPGHLPDLYGQGYSVYGPMVGRDTVESAYLSLLTAPPETGAQSRFIYYLAAAERAGGLVPRSLPVPTAYRGGIDFETYGNDEFPLVIVNAEPSGAPERHGGGQYGQWFEVHVACLVQAETEDMARVAADRYGLAVAACVLQNGSLGDLEASKTNLRQFPAAQFVNADRRTMTRSVVAFHSYVEPLFAERYGPIVYGPDPYADPGYYPVVQEADTDVEGEGIE